MVKKRLPYFYDFEVEYKGKIYKATYTIESECISVTSDEYGTKSAHIGGFPLKF